MVRAYSSPINPAIFMDSVGALLMFLDSCSFSKRIGVFGKTLIAGKLHQLLQLKQHPVPRGHLGRLNSEKKVWVS
jgi:hypothetical protein